MTRHLGDLGTAFGLVFARPAYRALAVAVAILAFVLAVWLPNVGLIVQVFLEPGAPPAAALGIALNLLGGIGTNFSALAAGYTVAIAALFGLTIAMVLFSVHQGRVAAAGKSIAVGSGAIASGVVGIGCAACGSLIMGALLPALGAAGALAALPLNGEEFGILSVALLFVSLLLVSRNIAGSVACPRARARGGQTPQANSR